MDGIKLIRVVLITVFSILFLAPASARTSDTPGFGVWLAQWGQHSRQVASERLPCLRADKTTCTGPFSSTSAALGQHSKGRVDPFKRSAQESTAHRRKVVYKRIKRVHAPSRFNAPAMDERDAFAGDGQWLIMSGASYFTYDDLLGDQDQRGAAAVEPLAAMVADAQMQEFSADPLVSDVAAGVGNNAYAALYDFEDQGGPGESQRDFPEIASLASTPAALLAAADVPEPASLALVGAGLLILRLHRRGFKAALPQAARTR